MYYFGYAPIKISHEVKYHIVQREIKYNTIQVFASISDIELSNSFDNSIIVESVKNDLVKKLLDEARIYIYWEINKDELRRTNNYKATLLVGTNPDLK